MIIYYDLVRLDLPRWLSAEEIVEDCPGLLYLMIFVRLLTNNLADFVLHKK